MADSIRIENLSKQYNLGKRRAAQSFGEMLSRKLSAPFRGSEAPREKIWALKDISLNVGQGEILGVIGRNGSGKSTLLKILSRITEPTAGRVQLSGRVSSLLEVGTGFHPELTGRENIFLNGAILGMKKNEIVRKFDEIVAFAEVEQFIDTPVKHYSSGMYVRLAFAVAAHLEPEILLVDEVLAVGDMSFQKKCLSKMHDINEKGLTLIFVSHNVPAISLLCKKCVLLDKGQLVRQGPTAEVMRYYYADEGFSAAATDLSGRNNVGDATAALLRASLRNADGKAVTQVAVNEPCSVTMEFRILKKSDVRFVPSFHFNTAEGVAAFVSALGEPRTLDVGDYTASCDVPANFLNNGTYFVGVALTSMGSGMWTNFWEHNLLSFTVSDPLSGAVGRESGYAGPIPGVVRPQLKWQLRRNP